MSTILKALRRIEDEKAPPPGARPLREEVAAVPGETLVRRRSRDPGRLVLAAGLAAASILLGVGGVLWLRGGGTEPPADPPLAPRAAAAPRAPSSPAPSPSPGQIASLSPERTGEALRTRPAVPVPATAPAPAAPPAEPLTRIARSPAPRPPAPSASVPSAPSAPGTTVPGISAPGNTPPRNLAEGTPAASPPDPDPAPATRHVLPELTVAGTVWHPLRDKRTARVELAGREEPVVLREGDAVGSLVVKAIEPSGVVFRMGEVEVRRRVGE